MRAGESLYNHHHPAAINMIIRGLRIDCYRFLWVGDGRFSAPLHRMCTIQSLLDKTPILDNNAGK